ncbi:hypothetical protein F5Y06DRAFT_297712 [Hypoxylon sp. FL0890]|nr:hypothetical protein F5Y06DRAFT_297712 [Hypoxylon sp. FL0890]
MSTITDHVASCLELFKYMIVDTIHDPSNQPTISRIADEFARFKIWSGNIGAHRSGKSSLDYRLRDASHLQIQVKNLLVDLNDSLKNALAIISGEKIPWDELPAKGEDSDQDLDGPADHYVEFDTELAQISADVTEVVDCLLRLSVSIRNPAPHDRLKASTRIDVSPYEAHDISHIAAKFQLANPKLAEHLGKANSRRRQFFKYRASHHAILSEGLNADSGKSVLGKLSTVASSIPQHLKDNPLEAKSDPIDEDELSESGVTQTSYATTQGGSDRPHVPALPAEALKGPFECPFCYTMISVSSRRAWKSTGVFTIAHSAITPPFDSSIRLRGHLQDHHLNAASDDQLRASVELCTSSGPLDRASNCPLCEELLPSTKEYKRHVGRHLEDIALFVLPRAFDDDSDEEVSEEQASGSSDGSFVTALSASHRVNELEGVNSVKVQQETFSIGEISDDITLNNDEDHSNVLRPYAFEDADSDRSQSRSPPPPDIDPTVMAGLENLTAMEDSDTEFDAFDEKMLLKRRLERRRRRMQSGSLGSLPKRTLSEGSSDSDTADLPPPHHYEKRTSPAVFCPTCKAKGQEVWVFPGRDCPYCGTYIASTEPLELDSNTGTRQTSGDPS